MDYYIEKAKICKKTLELEGWISNSKAHIEIFTNKKKLKDLPLNKERKDISKYFNNAATKLGFSYEIPLPYFCSKVRIILKNNEKILTQMTINNSFFKKIINKIYKLLKLIGKSVQVIIKNPTILFSKKLLSKYFNVFKDKYYDRNIDNTLNPFHQKEYIEWIIQNEDMENVRNNTNYKYQPKISFILPVYNPKLSDLQDCIESILNQTYSKFEICIVDDCSTKKEILDYLKELEHNPNIKIQYHTKNQHIAKTSNDALNLATGEFIALIDHDDTISLNALEEVVIALNRDKNIDFIYSDFDKLDANGLRCNPYFKPDFSPDTLLSFNYLSHFNVIRKKIIEKVHGFDEELIGAQDYDLYLKITEKTNKIYHIPKILYHWRMTDNSTSNKKSSKNYAYENGKKALENAINRRKLNAKVEVNKNSSFYTIHYQYTKEPKISILIPTKDFADILKKCIDSILKKTTYKNYEIIIINNGSKEKKTFKLFEQYQNDSRIKIVDLNCEFNFSYLNNQTVKICNGEYLVLLNNDTEVITPNWLEIMVGYAMQKHIGAVGVKLLYPDHTIQHGGVILGLGGVASHSFISEPRNYKAFNGLLEVPTNYAAVTAACLMVEKRKYLEVNGLNEELKVAYNDIDFNIKLLEKGYYNVFLPQVELYHHESKSRGLDTSGEKYERFLKESSIMLKNWKSYIEQDPFYNINYSLKSAFRLDKNNESRYKNED